MFKEFVVIAQYTDRPAEFVTKTDRRSVLIDRISLQPWYTMTDKEARDFISARHHEEGVVYRKWEVKNLRPDEMRDLYLLTRSEDQRVRRPDLTYKNFGKHLEVEDGAQHRPKVIVVTKSSGKRPR